MNKYLEKIAELDKESGLNPTKAVSSIANRIAGRGAKVADKPVKAGRGEAAKRLAQGEASKGEARANFLAFQKRKASNSRTSEAVARQRQTVEKAKANKENVVSQRREANTDQASIKARSEWSRREAQATNDQFRTARQQNAAAKPSERLLTTDALKNKFGGLHNRPAAAAPAPGRGSNSASSIPSRSPAAPVAPAPVAIDKNVANRQKMEAFKQKHGVKPAAPAPAAPAAPKTQGKATFDTNGKSVERALESHGTSGATPKVNIASNRTATSVAQAKPGLWNRMKNKFSSKPAAPGPVAPAAPTTTAAPAPAGPSTASPRPTPAEKPQTHEQALAERNAANMKRYEEQVQPKINPAPSVNAPRATPNEANYVKKGKDGKPVAPETKGLTEGQKTALKVGGGVVGGAVLMSALSKKPQQQTPQTPYY